MQFSRLRFVIGFLSRGQTDSKVITKSQDFKMGHRDTPGTQNTGHGGQIRVGEAWAQPA